MSAHLHVKLIMSYKPIKCESRVCSDSHLKDVLSCCNTFCCTKSIRFFSNICQYIILNSKQISSVTPTNVKKTKLAFSLCLHMKSSI